jgi:hypothetical protein
MCPSPSLKPSPRHDHIFALLKKDTACNKQKHVTKNSTRFVLRWMSKKIEEKKKGKTCLTKKLKKEETQKK